MISVTYLRCETETFKNDQPSSHTLMDCMVVVKFVAKNNMKWSDSLRRMQGWMSCTILTLSIQKNIFQSITLRHKRQCSSQTITSPRCSLIPNPGIVSLLSGLSSCLGLKGPVDGKTPNLKSRFVQFFSPFWLICRADYLFSEIYRLVFD